MRLSIAQKKCRMAQVLLHDHSIARFIINIKLVPVPVAKVPPRKNVCTSKASDEREEHLEAQRRAWADMYRVSHLDARLFGQMISKSEPRHC